MPVDNKKEIELAIQELVHAHSSLNMEPRPMPSKEGCTYLSDIDYWVKHSYEHIDKAIEILFSLVNQ